jgi:hypothetical protein
VIARFLGGSIGPCADCSDMGGACYELVTKFGLELMLCEPCLQKLVPLVEVILTRKVREART